MWSTTMWMMTHNTEHISSHAETKFSILRGVLESNLRLIFFPRKRAFFHFEYQYFWPGLLMFAMNKPFIVVKRIKFCDGGARLLFDSFKNHYLTPWHKYSPPPFNPYPIVFRSAPFGVNGSCFMMAEFV